MAKAIYEGLKFRYKTTVIHRLDPRVKMLLSIVLFALALLGFNFYQEIITFVLVAVPATLAKSLKRLMRVVALSITFGVFVVAINLLAGGTVVESIVLAVRFLEIVASTSLFFVTTSPDELEYVLRWFRMPRDFVFAFATSIRFVPVLLMDLTQIIDAQKSRGLELDKGGPIKRIRNLVPVLIPLIVNSLVRSGELAEAMESRGYGAVKKPTSMDVLRLKTNDWAALSLILPGGALLIWLYIYVI